MTPWYQTDLRKQIPFDPESVVRRTSSPTVLSAAAGGKTTMPTGTRFWPVTRESTRRILITACACTLLSNAFLVIQHYRNAASRAASSDSITANLVATLVAQYELAALGVLQSYADRPLLAEAVRKKDIAGSTRHLRSLKENNSEIDTVFVTDQRGVLWVNFPFHPESIGKDFSDHDWYKGVSKDWHPYVSSVYKMIIGEQELAVAISVPVRTTTGAVIGILSTGQRLGSLARVIEQTLLATQAKVTLIDQTGKVIFTTSNPPLKEIVAYPRGALVLRAVREERPRFEFQAARGWWNRTHATVAPMKSFGWSVVLEQTNGDILRGEYGDLLAITLFCWLFFAMLSFPSSTEGNRLS